jgi:hypothetical protein
VVSGLSSLGGVLVGGILSWVDVGYGGGVVGAGGTTAPGLNNQPARAPPATIPAPAAMAKATVAPVESVVVTVVAAVIGGARPVIEIEVGVKVAVMGSPETVVVEVTGRIVSSSEPVGS